MSKAKLVSLGSLLGSLVYFMIFHWGRFLQDFWPIDASRVSPNIMAAAVQYVCIGVVLYLLYPPARKAVDKWVTGHLHASQVDLHNRLDTVETLAKHIIKHHPNIPNHVPGVGDVTVASTHDESQATPPPTSPAGS